MGIRSLFRALIMGCYAGRAVRRRLPVSFGSLAIHTTVDTGGIRHLRQDPLRNDPDLGILAETFVQAGDVVWDIGGNIGLFALCAAHQAGRSGSVLSVEADPWLASLIQRSALTASAEGKPCATLSVLSVAVAGSCDLAQFVFSADQRCTNSLAGTPGQRRFRAMAAMPVVTVTLDWLAVRQPSPQVLKIDVEGAELQVLAGAEQLLTRSPPPAIIIEIWKENLAPALERLAACGYQVRAQHDYDAYQADGPFNFVGLRGESGRGRANSWQGYPLPAG